MKKILPKVILFGSTCLLLVIAEIIMNHEIYGHFVNNYFLLELSSIFIVMSPIFLFKKIKNSFIYSSILFVFTIIIITLNMLLYYASGDIFSFKYILLITEASKAVNMHYINFVYIAIMLSIIAVYIALGVIFVKKIKTKPTHYYKLGISTFVIIILCSLLIRLPVNSKIVDDYDKNALYNNKDASEVIAYSSNYSKKSSLEQYGLYNHSLAEINNVIETKVNYDIEKSELDEYFSTVEEKQINDFSGLLNGMNVITIMVETGVPFAINEYLTPNLYSIQSNGINLTNTHSKNKTNASEFIGMTGSSNGVTPKKDIVVPYSVANILKQNGYTTTYLHDNNKSYYSRENYIQNLGFDNTYFLDEINPEDKVLFDGNFPLDSKFIEKTVEYMVPDTDKFYTFYTTISSHGPYNKGEDNIQYFKDNGYYDKIDYAINNNLWTFPYNGDDEEVINQIKNYVCEIMNLDLGIQTIIDRLKETNHYDDTLLVIYGDHDIYYRTNNKDPLKNYIYDVNDISIPYQYQTLFLISNPILNAKYNDKYQTNEYKTFATPYQVVPTILDLLGVNYNPRYYIGKSIFNITSDLDAIFYSHELNSIFDDKVFSYDLLTAQYANCSVEYQEQFFTKTIELMHKIEIFNTVYNINYFAPKE